MYVSDFVASLQLIKEPFSQVQVVVFFHINFCYRFFGNIQQFQVTTFHQLIRKAHSALYINTYPYDGILS